MDDYEEDKPSSEPPPRPPKNNINVFVVNENIGMFPNEIFDGKMGPLPLLIYVNVGYDPYDPDPFMYHYESQEIMFAYKKDAQKRVLIRDGHQRTLSLPLHTSLPFYVGRDSKEMTMEQIVASQPLPVTVRFAHGESMTLTVDKRAADCRYFGTFLTVTAVYDEPFIWCLPVEANGTTKDKPIVLPRNLKSAGFSPVVGIAEVNEPAEVLKGFIQKYSQEASQLKFQGDPFFQELAFVNRGTDPVEADNIKPYIDETTFIPIRLSRRQPPQPPVDREPPPLPPPRIPLCLHQQPEEEKNSEDQQPYSSLTPPKFSEHIYDEINNPVSNRQARVSEPTGETQAQSELVEPLVKSPAMKIPLMGDPKDHQSAVKSPAMKIPLMGDPKDHQSAVSERKLSSEGVSGNADSSRRCNKDLMKPPTIPSHVVLTHLSSLTVDGVADVLKTLGLGKYAKKFQKNRIDGRLLQKIPESDMRSEFGMSKMESMKLQTFITDGHIPQMANSKTKGKSTFRL